MKYLGVFVILMVMIASCRHAILGEEKARQALSRALSDSSDNYLARGIELIPDKETATKFAEVILFKIYGEDEIKDERPYEVYKIDGYWIVRGTIPIGYDGGGFEIIFQSANGKVISLKHYK